jgi:hypothetical protein
MKVKIHVDGDDRWFRKVFGSMIRNIKVVYL